MSRAPATADPFASPHESLRSFRADPLGLMTRLAQEHGDVASIDMGRFRVFLISHPDHVKDILVTNQARFEKGAVLQEARRLLGDGLLTSEGEVHHRQRRLIQPVFHHRRMSEHVGLLVERAARTADGWRDGEIVDVPDEMVRLTMSALGKVVFDADIEEDEARETARALATCLGRFGRLASPYARLLGQIPTRGNREFERVLHTFDETVERLVREHHARGSDGGSDVLSQLMSVRDDATGEAMSDRQLRDEILTFMIAGHETWTNSLIWTWYLLSENPDVREEVEAEIDEVLAGRSVGAEDVRALRFTEAVYSESLRIYPPVWTVGRTAMVDHEVGGRTIPAGSIVLLSQYVVQHDPRWFPDPWVFRPQRWLSDDADRAPTFATFPFGAGPRVCIGQPLATLGSVVFLATIAARWRLDLVAGHPVEPLPPLMRPAKGLPMIARKRTA